MIFQQLENNITYILLANTFQFHINQSLLEYTIGVTSNFGC